MSSRLQLVNEVTWTKFEIRLHQVQMLSLLKHLLIFPCHALYAAGKLGYFSSQKILLYSLVPAFSCTGMY